MKILKYICFSLCFSVFTVAQTQLIQGEVTDDGGHPLNDVSVVNKHLQVIAKSNKKGMFIIDLSKVILDDELTFFLTGYQTLHRSISKGEKKIKIVLHPLKYHLSEVVVREKHKRNENFRRLRDVEGMSINAGKKSEVVLLEKMTVNRTTNSARQIFSKVVGLTVNEGSSGGLQLNIGGRGLNPNRTANFNTRQNGYDISADVLGYPESYYTPASDGVKEIQVIRGAASLQYGTQFGGAVNFKMKEPSKRKMDITQHISYGSYNLMSSFTEIGGTVDKFGYYTFYNYKQGGGFRPNSNFYSHNAFAYLNYQLSDRSSVSLDVLKFYYQAQQPGGLTNYMFYTDMFQSNRNRNWFRVDWNIVNLKYQHLFEDNTRFSIQAFGLKAQRVALGFRSHRVSDIDPGSERDLLIGDFLNWGSEARLIHPYRISNQLNTLLLGVKYYQSRNHSKQGAGSASSDADFSFAEKKYPYYPNSSSFDYPNLNIAFFAENIFKISDNQTLTPGFRVEYIKTESQGYYRTVLQHAGQVISDNKQEDNVSKKRWISLLGVGYSYRKPMTEWYANLSQNYRSVTFSDIHSNTPGFAISPSITDEKGFTFDFGLRGEMMKKVLSFDTNVFTIYYGNRIGEYFRKNIERQTVERYRDNVGVALIYGWECLLDWNLQQTFWKKRHFQMNSFVNIAVTDAKYIRSDIPGVEGNTVEFVPTLNLKMGVSSEYKKWKYHLQLTAMSEQFSDALNQITPDNDNTGGIFGTIPPYYVVDFSTSFKVNSYLTLEGSIQNITNNKYFTQRATGYPGPGIIPSDPVNFVFSADIHL